MLLYTHTHHEPKALIALSIHIALILYGGIWNAWYQISRRMPFRLLGLVYSSNFPCWWTTKFNSCARCTMAL